MKFLSQHIKCKQNCFILLGINIKTQIHNNKTIKGIILFPKSMNRPQAPENIHDELIPFRPQGDQIVRIFAYWAIDTMCNF
jgi:hypothetical protein